MLSWETTVSIHIWIFIISRISSVEIVTMVFTKECVSWVLNFITDTVSVYYCVLMFRFTLFYCIGNCFLYCFSWDLSFLIVQVVVLVLSYQTWARARCRHSGQLIREWVCVRMGVTRDACCRSFWHINWYLDLLDGHVRQRDELSIHCWLLSILLKRRLHLSRSGFQSLTRWYFEIVLEVDILASNLVYDIEDGVYW
jgi:hypothetical protein